MDINPITKKSLVYAAIFSFLIILALLCRQLFDNRTTVVFCDVGQGDAAYIRIKNKIDVLVDAGPDKKVLDCLGRYMPFYDRTIELAVISHSQKDHVGGLRFILDRYTIDRLIVGPLDDPSVIFEQIKQMLVAKKVPVTAGQAGLDIAITGDRLDFYWPTRQYIDQNIIFAHHRNNLSDILGEGTVNDNNFSLILSLEENGQRILFTGDASAEVLDRLSPQYISHIDILKIPHHGSKNGLNRKFLELADPKLAVISVGAKNSYGHPAGEVLQALEALHIKIRRTDLEGDIIYKLR